MTALVLDSTVSGGASSLEAARATANGFTVTVVDEATWATMTAASFAAYQLVIIGDPECGSVPQVVSQNAQALADAVMGRAGGNTKAGNRILIGTDPAFHSFSGGGKLINSGIDFAGAVPGATSLYLDLSCDDADYDGDLAPDALTALLPRLTIDTSPNWTENASPPCGGAVSLIANQGAFSTLTSTDLQDWGCSVHLTFPSYPTDWTPLAVATDTPTAPTCGRDVSTGSTACGESYVLVAGSGITATAPNLALSPLTATNPVGTLHTVTATVTNNDATPRAGETVTFLVTGANAGAVGTCSPSTCVSDSAGHVTFTYTGASAGNDTISASVTISGSTQTATAAKTWTPGGEAKPTSTTYTGGSGVQYSDPVTLSGRLLDTSVSPAVAVPGKQLGFTVGTQSTSASPTDASGDVSTSLVVTQLPGSVSSVGTAFAGDSGYAASSDSDPFAISKEDCTVTYSGATLVAALTNTTLAADLGELDVSLGDRSGKTIVFTVVGTAGTQTFNAVTDATGHASTSQPLIADAYGVSAAFAGDGYYLSCATPTDTLVTVQAAGAKVTGGGWTSVSSGRTSFGMNAIPQTDGTYTGQFQLRSKGGKNRFHGNAVSGFTSSGNTATWTMAGKWDGVTGYRLTVTVVDNGSSGSKRGDTISVVVRDAGGSTVFTTSGAQLLKGGNITVH